MKIVVPKLVFLVVITIATSCAANGVVEEGGSLLVNEDERAAIINTFLPPDREFELMGVTQKVSKGSKKTPILRYSKVTIQNDTPYDTTNGPSEGINPYDTFVYYSAFCETDYIPEGIRTGYMWTGPRRGGCLVEKVDATLARPGGNLVCDNYYSSVGTTHADYFIILIGNKCCVRSSYQTQNECPWIKERNLKSSKDEEYYHNSISSKYI